MGTADMPDAVAYGLNAMQVTTAEAAAIAYKNAGERLGDR